MVGGYPNEMQTLYWLKEDYVLSTDSAFFVYILVMVLLFLIGQRTQRQHLMHEIERNASDYQRITTTGEDMPQMASSRASFAAAPDTERADYRNERATGY